MNQEERRRFLIEELLRERLSCRRQEIPADTDRQKVLLRSLMNVRHPGAISQRFLEVQDAYLQGDESRFLRLHHRGRIPPCRRADLSLFATTLRK